MPSINRPDAMAFAALRRSAALPVHSKERSAGEINHLQPEAAVAGDPLLNCNWIKIPQRSRRGIIDDFKSEKARAPGGVKTKDGSCCDADSVARYDAEQHGTGGRTGSVDDDVLAGVTQRHKARPVDPDIAAAVVCNAHGSRRGIYGRCGSRRGDRRSDHEHGQKPTSPLECRGVNSQAKNACQRIKDLRDWYCRSISSPDRWPSRRRCRSPRAYQWRPRCLHYLDLAHKSP